MLKELVLVILLGLFIGFGATGSILGIKRILTKKPNLPSISAPTPSQKSEINITIPEPSPTPNNIQDNNQTLSVQEPKNNSVVATDKTTLVGKSTPNSSILILTPTSSYYTTSSSSGDYKSNITLEPGQNEILITSATSEGQSQQLTIFLTYSNAKF